MRIQISAFPATGSYRSISKLSGVPSGLLKRRSLSAVAGLGEGEFGVGKAHQHGKVEHIPGQVHPIGGRVIVRDPGNGSTPHKAGSGRPESLR